LGENRIEFGCHFEEKKAGEEAEVGGEKKGEGKKQTPNTSEQTTTSCSFLSRAVFLLSS
jgi:hypothetical protein